MDGNDQEGATDLGAVDVKNVPTTPVEVINLNGDGRKPPREAVRTAPHTTPRRTERRTDLGGFQAPHPTEETPSPTLDTRPTEARDVTAGRTGILEPGAIEPTEIHPPAPVRPDHDNDEADDDSLGFERSFGETFEVRAELPEVPAAAEPPTAPPEVVVTPMLKVRGEMTTLTGAVAAVVTPGSRFSGAPDFKENEPDDVGNDAGGEDGSPAGNDDDEADDDSEADEADWEEDGPLPMATPATNDSRMIRQGPPQADDDGSWSLAPNELAAHTLTNPEELQRLAEARAQYALPRPAAVPVVEATAAAPEIPTLHPLMAAAADEHPAVPEFGQAEPEPTTEAEASQSPEGDAANPPANEPDDDQTFLEKTEEVLESSVVMSNGSALLIGLAVALCLGFVAVGAMVAMRKQHPTPQVVVVRAQAPAPATHAPVQQQPRPQPEPALCITTATYGLMPASQQAMYTIDCQFAGQTAPSFHCRPTRTLTADRLCTNVYRVCSMDYNHVAPPPIETNAACLADPTGYPPAAYRFPGR